MPRAIDKAVLPRIRRQLLRWFDRNRRDLPWRRTSDPYAIWLSEMMLQQTQVATVIPYYERFLRHFRTVQDLAAADADEVLALWAGLGYYARAANLQRAARMIVAEFDGRFPQTVDELLRLPGVGPYSAAAVASIAFGVRAATVDGNVLRVLARLFDVRADVRRPAGRKTVQRLAERLLPTSRCGDFNQAMMELGATVCLPGRAATCQACPLAEPCLARQRGIVEQLPRKTAKQAPCQETHVVAAVARDGRWLFRRRPERGLWGGLWEMPTGVLHRRSTVAMARQLAQRLTGEACEVERRAFCRIDHVLTHKRVTFVGHVCRLKAGRSKGVKNSDCSLRGAARRRTARDEAGTDGRQACVWRRLDELGSLPISSAMRQIIAALGG